MRASEASTPNSGVGTSRPPGASPSTGLVTPDLRQTAVDQCHGHGSLADGRGAPLDRSMPHITRREETGQVGLERQRLALQRPPSEEPLSSGEIAPRYQISAVVALDCKRPDRLGARDASDGDEQRIGRKSFRKRPPIACQNQLPKATVPFGREDLYPGSDHDVAHG